MWRACAPKGSVIASWCACTPVVSIGWGTSTVGLCLGRTPVPAPVHHWKHVARRLLLAVCFTSASWHEPRAAWQGWQMGHTRAGGAGTPAAAMVAVAAVAAPLAMP